MQKIVKKRVVISLQEDGKTVYIKKHGFLGTPDTCETVPFEEATLFSNPKQIEHVLTKFRIPNPVLQVVTVTVEDGDIIESDSEKYDIYAELSREEGK